jgi:hypothetical protein
MRESPYKSEITRLRILDWGFRIFIFGRFGSLWELVPDSWGSDDVLAKTHQGGGTVGSSRCKARES